MGEWGAAALSAGVATILTALGIFLVRWFRARGGYAQITGEEGRKDRQQEFEFERNRLTMLLAECQKLLDEYRTIQDATKLERKDDRKLVHDLRDELSTVRNELTICQISRARDEGQIAALQQALDDAGIPHRPWEPAIARPRIHPPLPKPSEDAP